MHGAAARRSPPAPGEAGLSNSWPKVLMRHWVEMPGRQRAIDLARSARSARVSPIGPLSPQRVSTGCSS